MMFNHKNNYFDPIHNCKGVQYGKHKDHTGLCRLTVGIAQERISIWLCSSLCFTFAGVELVGVLGRGVMALCDLAWACI